MNLRPPFRRPRTRTLLALGVVLIALAVGGAWMNAQLRGPRRTAPPPGAVRAGDAAVWLVGCQRDPEDAARAFICSVEIMNAAPERRHLILHDIALGQDGRALATHTAEYHKTVEARRTLRPTVRLAGIDPSLDPQRLQVMVRLEARGRTYRMALPFAWGGPKKLPLIPYDFGR